MYMAANKTFSFNISLFRCFTAQQGSGHALTELIEARVALMLEASRRAPSGYAALVNIAAASVAASVAGAVAGAGAGAGAVVLPLLLLLLLPLLLLLLLLVLMLLPLLLLLLSQLLLLL